MARSWPHTITANQALGVAMFPPLMAITLGLAIFGYDGSGFAYLLQSGAPLRAVVHGKAMATWLVTLVLTVGFAIVEALLNGVVDQLGAAVLVGVGSSAWSIGIGCCCGVLAPRNQEHPSGGPARVLVAILAGIVMVAVGLGLMALALIVLGVHGWAAGLVGLVMGLTAGLLTPPWQGRSPAGVVQDRRGAGSLIPALPPVTSRPGTEAPGRGWLTMRRAAVLVPSEGSACRGRVG